MTEDINLNEIFFSLQGETTRTGIPCVFIRLAGCNLRCHYCDTSYAWENGKINSIDKILKTVSSFNCNLVEITGGEPLLQSSTPVLARQLVDKGYTVMIETNGTIDISGLPNSVIKIVDIKTPASGADKAFLYRNLKQLTKQDELKFVVSSLEDFQWMVEEIEKNSLLSICTVNASPVHEKVKPVKLAKWIIESGLNLRLNLQLHKQLNIP